MKKMFIVLCLFLLGCKSDHRPSSGEALIGYPLGAIVKPFQEIPQLEKVTLEDNGSVIAEGQYLDGRPHGLWVDYDAKTGQPVIITSYWKGEKLGPHMTFDKKNGKIIKKAYYYKNDLQGNYITYENGKKSEVSNYDRGKLDGYSRKYYKNGKLLEELPYDRGVLNGTAKWYNQEGVMTIQYEYENGKFVKDTTPKSDSLSTQ